MGSSKEPPHRMSCDTQAPATRIEGPIKRDPDVLKREQELKRDTLHIFRRLQAATTKEEKSGLYAEAVKLFDTIEKRVGSAMSSVTSGRIVFCNALMECGGLDGLRDCQDSREPNATAL